MSKAIEENKLIVTIKRLFMRIQFILQIYVCTNKNHYKNKTNLPPLPSTAVTVFLAAEKLLSL